jgi:DNA-binding beta-propeller fold protein YncE
VQRVNFPAGSEPIMLRVSPDGKYVWVQTYKTNMNYVLDADSMAVMNAIQAGTDPEQSAFQPNGGPYGMIAHLSDSFLLVLDSSTGNEVARIELGKTQANISYTADGAIAFVTSPTGDEVVAIDMARLAVMARLSTGKTPMGLALVTLPGFSTSGTL